VGHPFEQIAGVGGMVAAGLVTAGPSALFVWRHRRRRVQP
jgi:hypothetical protein